MFFMHYTHTGQRRVADLRDVFFGQTAILTGGAPSLRKQAIERLDARGILTMAMNNAATHFRPALWSSGDNPHCYEPQVLMDPRIMKFGSMAHAETELDEHYNKLKYRQMPNMFFYIPEDNVPWDEYLSPRRGVPWYNNTLFVSIHILYQLGIRRIILAGSDFGFAKPKDSAYDSDQGDMYAHKTKFSNLERKWNLDLYNSLVYELRRLKPVFEQAKLKFYDCSANSRLKQTYEHLTLEEAVDMCLEDFPEAMLDPAELPHCSKYAPEKIQKQIAKWPGHQVMGGPAAKPASTPKAQVVI